MPEPEEMVIVCYECGTKLFNLYGTWVDGEGEWSGEDEHPHEPSEDTR